MPSPSRPFGSWVLGGADESVAAVLLRARLLMTFSVMAANLAGAAAVFVLAAFVLPTPGVADSRGSLVLHLVLSSSYVLVATPLSIMWGTRVAGRRLQWLREGRSPNAREQRDALRIPAFVFRIQATFWSVAAALFGLLDASIDPWLGLSVASTVLLGGLVTGANAYFLSEFALRPVAARALAVRSPGRLFLPGLRARAVLAWGLGSAVPVLGLMSVAVAHLAGRHVTASRLSLTVLALGGVVLVFGLVTVGLASRATADPIRSVRAALARVEAGDLDVEVPIYDATDAGLLQAGFNRMVAGLREREHIRDLFGRHVGEEVARSALEAGVELGGEVRDVAVLFVDLAGSTAMAASQPAGAVVALLNRFFAVVVDVVDAHDGFVNKFLGDAALAVFGAPVTVTEASTRALAAARELVDRLHEAVPECDVGIGVAAGPAVAGNVGEARRYEYTVIGDPVNEAARITELAKLDAGRVLASGDAVSSASSDEAAHWRCVDEVTLRGRSTPTRLMAPTRALE